VGRRGQGADVLFVRTAWPGTCGNQEVGGLRSRDEIIEELTQVNEEAERLHEEQRRRPPRVTEMRTIGNPQSNQTMCGRRVLMSWMRRKG
jgi:hypothetical protein